MASRAFSNFGAFLGAPFTESGPFGADTLTRTYANRVPQGLTLAQPAGSWSASFGYDSLLRLHTLTSPAGTFTYNYYGAGRQINTLSLPGGNSISESFDGAGQLLNTTLSHGTSALDEYSYEYDAAGHRTSVQRVDGATVNYGYDDIGEVISAVGSEPYPPGTSTQRANENDGYGYDPAENLLLRTNNALIQGFESDNANELVSVTRDNNLLTVAGSVSNNVTALAVNGQAAALYHDGTYAVAGGVPLAQKVNVFTGVVTVAGVTRTNQFSTELPVTVNLRYDANGNLIWDGLIAYGYDAANELTSATVTNCWRTQYQYDGLGRRRVRTDYAWLGRAWVPTNGVRYVYDGKTVLQERTTNNVPVVTYTRGVDLSGTLQGAGGIGGLLARTDGNGRTFYHCDGNGNITALVNGSGTVVAKYLYDSFGNTLGMWGALAAGNAYRYSSKEVDLRSGSYYYGYRWYQPNLQRWVNPDPLGEAGGINLYGFVGNGPIDNVDPFGLFVTADPSFAYTIAEAVQNSTFGVGIVGSASMEGGYIIGGGVSFSGGIGLFHNPQDGWSVGSFLSGGAFFGGPLGSINWPANQCQKSGVFGKSAGFTGGAFATNAGTSSDLYGPFNQWNGNIPDVSASYAQSGDIGIFSITGGYGGGFSASSYPTTTFNTSGFYPSSGQLVSPPNP